MSRVATSAGARIPHSVHHPNHGDLSGRPDFQHLGGLQPRQEQQGDLVVIPANKLGEKKDR